MPIKNPVVAILTLVFLTACGSANDKSFSDTSTADGDEVFSSPSPTEGSSDPITISNTVDSPEELNVGDLLMLDLNATSKSLDFGKVDNDAEFVLVVSNVSATSGNLTVQINNNLTESSLEVGKAMTVSEFDADHDEAVNITESFHNVLRVREAGIVPVTESAELSLSKSENGLAYAISSGDTETFKILSSVTSSTATSDLTAKAECVRDGFVFYVDERVTGDMITSTDLGMLCDQFDATFNRQIELFGGIPDVDKNGKLMVLFTPGVNNLGASGGGIITGFFSASDLYPATSSNPASNEGEILYIVVPDPQGKYGTPISNSFGVSNLLPPVLVHEMQHLQNYNQHVLQGGSLSEESWLNEGLSHLAEDLFGQNQENPSRYGIFLKSPHSYPLVTSGAPGIASRGASYLFLRYLYEQHTDGELFVKSLLRSKLRGIQNVEVSFGGTAEDFDQFGEFLLRWSLALALTDLNLTSDARYIYEARVYNTTTGQFSGVCLVCDPQDGRGTTLTGIGKSPLSGVQTVAIKPTVSRFYTVGASDDIDFSQFSSGGSGAAALIRTR